MLMQSLAKGQFKAKLKLLPAIMQTNEYPPSQVECSVTKIEANIKSRAQATKDIVQNFLYAELDHVSQAVDLKTEYKTC